MFRGLLGSVGSSVGGGGSSSVATLEAKVRQLTADMAVLQEELESKIVENEQLVMDNCECKRERRDAEQRADDMVSEMARLRESDSVMRAQVEKISQEKSVLVERLETSDIKMDALNREIQLQAESVHKLKGSVDSLTHQLDEVSSNKAFIELELREVKSALTVAESKLAHTIGQFTQSDTERASLQSELSTVKAKNESLNLRITQLEEELCVASIQAGPVLAEDDDESSGDLPKCGGDPQPCCYRSEYFRDKWRNSELNLKGVSGKLAELHASGLMFSRNNSIFSS